MILIGSGDGGGGRVSGALAGFVGLLESVPTTRGESISIGEASRPSDTATDSRADSYSRKMTGRKRLTTKKPPSSTMSTK